jgi:hypothetical protein
LNINLQVKNKKSKKKGSVKTFFVGRSLKARRRKHATKKSSFIADLITKQPSDHPLSLQARIQN